MEQLKAMKQALMTAAQSQMGDLASVDAKELGEVIDMIKDLAETCYYCAITEAMEEKKEQQPVNNTYYYTEYMKEPAYWCDPYMERDMDRDRYNRMYYGNNGGGNNGPSSSSNGSGNMGNNSNGRSYYTERPYQPMMRDWREGRSPMMRKAYMESKEMHHDKATQLKDLENYMQELTQDITEMIDDATPEEKQMLQKKIATLASKIS